MATLRLFAGLRDAAGMPRAEVPGSTVEEVIAEAVRRFGPDFGASVPNARVWVNGEEAEQDQPVGDTDEVALIPPVSGGSDVIASPTGVSPGGLTLGSIGAALVAANVFGSEAWVAAVVVGAICIWAVDLGNVLSARGRELAVIPVFVTVLAAVVSTRLLGAAGFAVTVAVAVIAPLVWGVMSETSRLIQIIAPSVLVSLMAGTAAASLLHLAFTSPSTTLGVFIVVALVAVPAGALMERFRNLPFGDPFTITALAAIIAALVAAAVWELELAAYLFVGVVLAVGLISGRGLGSIIRTQSVSLVERPPGLTWAADGVIVAAALYLPILALLT
jgi:molybdopterin converting factor small subunit